MMSILAAMLLDTRPVRLTWPAKIALVLLVFLGVTALPGGWALMTPPPGEGTLGMPLAWLEGSPFTSYFVPGLLLFGVFGVGSLVAAAAGLLRHWTAPYLAFAIGAGQMIWISVQVFIMSKAGIFFLQPALFTFGATLALLVFFWWRATRRPAEA